MRSVLPLLALCAYMEVYDEKFIIGKNKK